MWLDYWPATLLMHHSSVDKKSVGGWVISVKKVRLHLNSLFDSRYADSYRAPVFDWWWEMAFWLSLPSLICHLANSFNKVSCQTFHPNYERSVFIEAPAPATILRCSPQLGPAWCNAKQSLSHHSRLKRIPKKNEITESCDQVKFTTAESCGLYSLNYVIQSPT